LVEIYETLYGEIHVKTATAYYNLAEVYSSLKEPQKTLEHHSKALEIRKAIHGEIHQDTALAYDGP